MAEPDLIEIASDALRARINPFGAELWSLTDRGDREYLTDGDPAFWTGHAPLLFPIVGGLANDRYRIGGAEYALPRHGFARRSAFAVVETAPEAAALRLADSEETRAVYPFAFALDMAFRMVGTTLQMQATVRNTGDARMPFSFGFHPAFAWPLPGAGDGAVHRVTFAEPEPQPVRRLDPASGLLLPETFASPVDGRVLVPDAGLFADDALIWDDLRSRALTFGVPGGPELAIAMPDTPMLGIWQKPGARFLCIEPWQGLADPVGYDGDFCDKPGVLVLPPGGARSLRMDVNVVTG